MIYIEREGLRIFAAVCKSSFFHLRNIFKIREFLSHDTCETLIHAFITARIDYCNSLLYGQPKCILRRLQSVLNSAARLIHLTSRHEHITLLLIQLHWLPIEHLDEMTPLCFLLAFVFLGIRRF